MFDQDGDVLGLWLRLPTAAAQQEVATLALRRPHQTEAQPIRYGVGRRHCRQQRKQCAHRASTLCAFMAAITPPSRRMRPPSVTPYACVHGGYNPGMPA